METQELQGYTLQDSVNVPSSFQRHAKKRQLVVKKSTYFNVKTDIKLLQQVLQLNPYDDQDAWSEIVDNMNDDGLSCTLRQIKNRISILISKFQQDTLSSSNKAGTEEQWEERTTLITNVIGMMEASKITSDMTETGNLSSNSNSTITLHDKQTTAEERNAVAAIWDEEDEIPETPLLIKRLKLKRSYLEEQIDKKMELEHEYRMKKLELDHQHKMREQELQEQRLQHEARVSEQQNQTMMMIQQQQEIILNMLNRIVTK